jgi:hypothetical protein
MEKVKNMNDRFSDLEFVEIDETLYFFDFPLLFTFKHNGALFLASVLSEEIDSLEYLVSIISEDVLERVKNNQMYLRDALFSNEIYLMTLSYGNPSHEFISAERIFEIPEDHLPDANVYLYAD